MYNALFSTPAMTATLADRGFLAHMLRFEWSLSSALEQHHVVPQGTAKFLSSFDIEAFDTPALFEQAHAAGNICIPFVKVLTAQVATVDPSAAAYIHWGATSQDVIDTALMLQFRDALDLLEADLIDTCDSLAELIEKHRDSIMPGRTWLQQGPPVSLGLKLATWLDALQRHHERIADAKRRAIALQFGGAVGTLAPLGQSGVAVAESLGVLLNLPVPAIPWHTQRDRIGELATTLGLLTGTLGKIARDVSLLMQTEVAEVLEPSGAGRGGSSTMPHKRNPVYSAVMLAASVRVPGLVGTILSAMVQEHERGLGGWHAEWETLSEIFRLTAGALAGAKAIAAGLNVEADAMQRDLDLLQGVTMAEAVSFAVARKLGKSEAHRILEAASKCAVQQELSMHEALLQEPLLKAHFTADDFTRMLKPANYLGSTDAFIDRVLAAPPKRRPNAND